MNEESASDRLKRIKMEKLLGHVQSFLTEHLDCYALVGYTVDDKARVLVMKAGSDQQRDSITELMRISTVTAQDIMDGAVISTEDMEDGEGEEV